MLLVFTFLFLTPTADLQLPQTYGLHLQFFLIQSRMLINGDASPLHGKPLCVWPALHLRGNLENSCWPPQYTITPLSHPSSIWSRIIKSAAFPIYRIQLWMNSAQGKAPLSPPTPTSSSALLSSAAAIQPQRASADESTAYLQAASASAAQHPEVPLWSHQLGMGWSSALRKGLRRGKAAALFIWHARIPDRNWQVKPHSAAKRSSALKVIKRINSTCIFFTQLLLGNETFFQPLGHAGDTDKNSWGFICRELSKFN